VTSATQVMRIVAAHSVGDVVPVVVRRADKETTARVELAARPSNDEIVRMDHVGTFAPAWVGTTALTGAPSGLDKLRGRVVVLDFWASWCGPCRYAVPKLSALDARYRGQGLTIVGMTTDDAETAAVAATRLNMKYGVVVDERAQTSSAYGVSALPTMFVIDKRGVIRHVVMGYDPSEDARVEQLVQQLIAEPAPPPPTPPSASAAPAPSAQPPPRPSGDGEK
jgi:thiol-disulfide isomerase/thioredoxin